MTTDQKLIRNKLGLLDLASYLKNVSEACRVMDYSMDTFYRVKNAYEEGGMEALMEKSKRVPNLKNRIPEDVEAAILELTLENPALARSGKVMSSGDGGSSYQPIGRRRSLCVAQA